MSKEVYRLEIPIVIQDEYSKEIKKIQDALKGITKKKPKLDIDEKEARRKIEELQKRIAEMSKRKNKPKIDIDNRPAAKKIGETQKKLSSFQRFANRLNRMKLSVQDNASRMITRVQQRLDQLKNSKVGQITISAVDKTRGVFASVRRAVTSLPGMVTIGLSVVGGAKAFSYITEGMEQARVQEHDMVRMTHWLKKDQENMKDMTTALNDSVKFTKQYASSTAFDAAPVNAAYATALQIASGDRKEAERLTRLAGDMAVLDDGDITRAMQAIFNANNGLYEMMDAYSPTKINKEFADKHGGIDGILDFMRDEVGGAAEMYGKTGVGNYSAMQGKLSQLKTDIGNAFHEGMQPMYTSISDGVDALSQRLEPVLANVGKGISEWLSKGLEGDGILGRAGKYIDELMDIMDPSSGSDYASMSMGERLQEVLEKVQQDAASFWDNTLQPKAVELGKSIGEAVIDAIIEGIPMVAESIGGAIKNQVVEAIKNPTAGNIGSAALALGGAGWLGGKMLGPFGGYKGLGKGVKKLGRGTGALLGGMGGLFGGIGRSKYQQRPKKTRSTFYERDRRAREWSMRPENYRPPKQPKAPNNYNLGFSSGGPMAGIPKWLRGGSKGIMSKLPGLNVAFAGYDGFRGWQDADRRAGGSAGALDKAASALSSIAEGFSFGLIDGDKAFETIRGKKVPAESDMMHIDPMHDMDPRMRHGMNEDGSMDSRFSSAEGTTFASDFDDPFDMFNEEMNALVESVTSAKETFEAMNEGLEGMDEFTESFSAVSEMFESLQERMEAFEELAEPMESFGENFTAISEMLEETRERLEQFSETMAEPAEQLSEALPQIAEQIVEMQERLEEFSEMMAEPAEQMAEAFPLLAEQIVEMQERLEEFSKLVAEPADQFVESFTQVSEMMEQMRERLEEFSEATAEPSEMYVQNLTMMAELLEQSTEIVTEMNEMIPEQSALLGENMTVLGENLLQSGQIVQEGFTAIGAKSQEVVAALNTLIGHINTGAQAMSGLQQVQTHVSALNTALAGLASRVSNVQVPSSVSVGGVGPVKAYAKGGIATSPHIGLVAEAGVPEAMIPFDGSQRSKELWMTTGHALGMFDTSTSSEVNPYALDPIDTSESTTSTSSGGVVINNDIPIDIKSGANKEEIINRTLKEVEQKLRLVLETT